VAIRGKLYAVSSFVVLAGILLACLCPFHSPTNEVAWLAHGDGVRFGWYGTIVSRTRIRPPKEWKPSGWTLEIWVRPRFISGSGMMLAFYNRKRRRGFALSQSGAGLLMQGGLWNEDRAPGTRAFYADAIFSNGAWVFLTLVSGSRGTEIYVNGKLIQTAQHFVFAPSDLSGRLILANSPVDSDSWPGELRGLAIYNQELTANQVVQHYEAWTQMGRTGVNQDERAVALYLFDEHAGNVIRNQLAGGVDLFVPARYMEVHHAFLKWPWNEYHLDLSYLKDLIVNVAGFIPLGFFFYAYFSLIRRIGRSGLITIILGFSVSLTVEVLQAYLPTRDSGMTDIITNTLGTGAGVALFRCTSIICERFRDSRYSVLCSLASLVRDQQPANKRHHPPDQFLPLKYLKNSQN
jgi:VanZ family protein